MQVKYLTLIIAAVMYLFAVIFKKNKIYFSTAAAFLVILLGMIFPNKIFALPKDILAMNENFSMSFYALSYSFTSAIPWNLFLIIAGVMITSELFIYSKVPEKIASLLLSSVKIPALSFVMLFAFTGLLSSFTGPLLALSVATPVIISLSNQLKFNPVFFLMSLAAVCMIESSAFIFASPSAFVFSEYSFFLTGNFFIYSARPSLFFMAQASLLLASAFFFVYFSRKIKGNYFVARVKIVSFIPLILYALIIAVLVICSLTPLRFEFTSGFLVLAIALTGLLWFYFFQKKTFKEAIEFLKKSDWKNFIYMAGFFIIAGSLKKSGMYEALTDFIVSKTSLSQLYIYIIVFCISLLAGSFLDALPFVIIFMPLVKSLSLAFAFKEGLLSASVLIACCSGAAFTPFSSFAGNKAVSLLKKEGYEIKALDWIKNVLPAAFIMTASYALLLYFVWK